MQLNENERKPTQSNEDLEFGLDGADTGEFDKRLELLRIEMGMTKGDFTGMLSIPDLSPGRYGEYDAQTLSIPHILFLIQRANVSAAWLMSGEGEMFSDGTPPHSMYDWCVGEAVDPVHHEILRRRWIGKETRNAIAKVVGLTASRVMQIENKYRNLYEARDFWKRPDTPIPNPRMQRLPGMSGRLQSVLYNDALTLRDCLDRNKEDLLRIPNLGRVVYSELEEILQSVSFERDQDEARNSHGE